jgi:hypothetical protein
MKTKRTPIQTLIDELVPVIDTNGSISMLYVKNRLNELLIEERKGIEEAFFQGFRCSHKFKSMYDNQQDYYDKVYGNK